MRKIQHLSLGFMIASLLSVSSLFAQEDDASLRPMPINSVSETSVDFSDLDAEIARLEGKLTTLSEENEQLRAENERLKSENQPLNQEIMTTGSDDDIDQPMDNEITSVSSSEDEDQIDSEIITQPASRDHTLISIDDDAYTTLPNAEEITYYQNLIDENILPYEVEQAQELRIILQDVENLIASDEDEALTLWQEFLQMLTDADELIDLHITLYNTMLPTVERQANVYLLHQPLSAFRDEVSAARIAFYDQKLTTAVEHLQTAQDLWQAIETNEQLMDLLDKHLEAAISIEILSQRYARGENEQFSQPTAWDAQKAEDNEIGAQDMAPEFANLQQAIMMWERSTFSAEEGDYDQALNYLNQAGHLITMYSQHSFSRVHTVRLNINRRESLWRIAEQMYGDGFQWRRIWEANQDIISNPDLIYPGQQLGIPEEKQVIVIAGTSAPESEPVQLEETNTDTDETDNLDEDSHLEEEQLSIDALLDTMSELEELEELTLDSLVDEEESQDILFIDENLLD